MKLSTLLAMQLLPIALVAGCQDDPKVDFAKARERFAVEDYTAASRAVGAALRIEPDNRDMLRLLAESQLRAGEADAAGRTIDRLKRAGLDRSEIARMRAELALIEGDADEALSLVESNRSREARYARAEALRMLGRKDEAATIFERGLAANDSRLAAAYARMKLIDGDIPAVRRIYERMRTFAPEAYATRILEGDLLRAQGRDRAAIAVFARAVRDFPQRADPMIVLASLLGDAGRIDQAQALFDKAEAIAPNHADLFALKIQLLSEQGKWRDIREALQGRESNLAPASPIGMSYARALLRLGQAEQARILFSRAALLVPDDPYLQMMLGEAQLATDDPRSAWETLEPLTKRADAPPELYALASKAARGVGDPAAPMLEAKSERLKEKASPG